MIRIRDCVPLLLVPALLLEEFINELYNGELVAPHLCFLRKLYVENKAAGSGID
jgi:hypothetical protein